MWSDWLVFGDYGFQSTLWWKRIRGLWKLLNGRDWLRGRLGLALLGMVMLSKSLIHFSVDGQGCVPSLFFVLRPNYGEGNEDNGDLLQKVPCTHCYTQCPQPCSRPLLTCTFTGDTQTLFWLSLCGVSGSWCTQDSVCALQGLFSQSCVSSGGSMVGLMATSSKRAYAIPRSAEPRAPAPLAGHCWFILPQETLIHSSGSVSVGCLGLGVHRVCLSPLSVSGAYGVWF